MLKPKFLILSGEGINCERETAYALNTVGALAHIHHVSEVIKRPKMIFDYQGFVFPGGFSYGDELGSGQVLTLKIKSSFYDELLQASERGLAILGICNGFQVLTRLGLLETDENIKNEVRTLSLVHNRQGHFIDRHVNLEVKKTSSWWTQHLEEELIRLPIRHGEGRLVVSKPDSLHELKNNNRIALSYQEDVNGSVEKIAALTNLRGNILGLMPHPEAGFYDFHHQVGSSDPLKLASGSKIFKSIIKSLNSK
jgi:phosphoribosylformylglycinamidine synthase subunit PurQ / glutaminase